MKQDVQVKTRTCPNCGDKLKYENIGETVICMSCETPVLITGEERTFTQEIRNSKIDEIKTSSTALAYIEQFLEGYDWYAFAFDYDFTIDELDRLVDSLKITAADDYRTWIAAFVSLVVPFEKKVEYRKKSLALIIDEFKKNNLDAYGMYDAYKNVAKIIVNKFAEVKEQATKIIGYAKKYGADKDTIRNCELQLALLNVAEIQKSIYNNVEDIPEIVKYKEEEQKRILLKYAEKGIDANLYYEQAKTLIEQKEYKNAIEKLIKIYEFRDSKKLIDDVEDGFLFSNVICVKGKYYILKKKEDASEFNLYEIEKGEKKSNPIIKGISNVIKLYANSIYYSSGNTLKVYDFDTKEKKVLHKESIKEYNFDVYQQAIYMLKTKSMSDGTRYDLKKFSLLSNQLTICETDISKVFSFEDGYCVYEKRVKEEEKFVKRIFVCDLKNDKSYRIGNDIVNVCGCIGDKVVYTKENPNDYNKNLYVAKLEENSAPKLLEANITAKCQVIEDKIFYFTRDNLDKNILITINIDGSGRKELASYVDKILFISGDWIYFKRTYRHNTALCKVKNDGSKVKVIASQIDEFIKIEAGYLYYISDERDLIKVRMDGSRKKILCSLVEQVLVLKDNKIIFKALDRIEKTTTSFDGRKKHDYSSSIYAIDFDGKGIRKAVYDVIEVANNKDDIYFVKREKVKQDGVEKNCNGIYKLNVENYSIERIVLQSNDDKKNGCYVATCVYGSYDCPEVWTLRRYRDNTLASTWYGRAFIRIYYAVSPTLVKWFGKTKWFKKMWKGKLDRMVKKLQDNGVEDTPYNDKNW